MNEPEKWAICAEKRMRTETRHVKEIWIKHWWKLGSKERYEAERTGRLEKERKISPMRIKAKEMSQRSDLGLERGNLGTVDAHQGSRGTRGLRVRWQSEPDKLNDRGSEFKLKERKQSTSSWDHRLGLQRCSRMIARKKKKTGKGNEGLCERGNFWTGWDMSADSRCRKGGLWKLVARGLRWTRSGKILWEKTREVAAYRRRWQ